MTITRKLEIYDALKKKLGERATRLLFDLMESQAAKEEVKYASNFVTKTEIINFKLEIIRWMFTFWVAWVLVVTVIICAL